MEAAAAVVTVYLSPVINSPVPSHTVIPHDAEALAKRSAQPVNLPCQQQQA